MVSCGKSLPPSVYVVAAALPVVADKLLRRGDTATIELNAAPIARPVQSLSFCIGFSRPGNKHTVSPPSRHNLPIHKSLPILSGGFLTGGIYVQRAYALRCPSPAGPRSTVYTVADCDKLD